MIEFLWFVAGLAVAFAAMRLAPRRTRAVSVAEIPAPDAGNEASPDASQPPQPAAESAGTGHGVDAELDDALTTMVSTVGSDLSGLATAIHGATERLFDALGDPQQVQQCAGDLWNAATRLQRFGQKLLAFFPSPGNDPVEPIDVEAVASALRGDCLEEHMGSIGVDMHAASDLPAALSNPYNLSHAMRFLLEGLLSLEPNAQHILLGLRQANEDDRATVQVEMRVHAGSEAPSVFAAQRLQLGYRAAQNLMRRCGGRVSLVHAVGADSAASIVMPATNETPTTTDGDNNLCVAPSDHSYGGVLVLEADPVLRTVIATELRLAGRSFSTCADGASAQALLEATPERFELVIAEQDARLLPGDVLIHDALTRFPELKGLLLLDGVSSLPDWLDNVADRYTVLPKPFQAQDLRASLAELLARARVPR